MIDLSYKVILQFEIYFSKILVVLSEKTVNYQTSNFKISSDVSSIKIKNAEKFPYMTVSMNAIVIDKNLLSKNELGDYKVILIL